METLKTIKKTRRSLSFVTLFIAVAGVFLLYGCNFSVSMARLVKDETTTGLRVIQAVMPECEVQQAVNDFIKLNNDNNSPVEKPEIKQNDGYFQLILPENTSYDLFCYWINFIVYSNKDKHYNDNVTGWYEVGADAVGAWKPFAGQKLMFFIPATDDEFDNVYFITEDNQCFKQQFAFRALLIRQNGVEGLKYYPNLANTIQSGAW